MTRALIDTSFLVALFNHNDHRHIEAISFSLRNDTALILPDIVLVEVAYLIRRELGIFAVTHLLDAITNAGTPFEPIFQTDIPRFREIMTIYQSAKLDFVDCAIMTIAERLDVTRICTFDRRDFSIVRPLHTDYFILLP